MKKRTLVRKTIPTKLKTAVDELRLSRIMTDKAYKLVSILLKKASYHNSDLSTYISLSANYLMKTFNKEYHKDFFNPLKYAGIIQSNEEYKQGSVAIPGYSKKYRINNELLNEEFTTITYEDRKGQEECEYISLRNPQNSPELSKYNLPIIEEMNTSYTNSTSTNSNTSSLLHISSRLFPKSYAIDDLNSLQYDQDKLFDKTVQVIEGINETSFILNDDIFESNFEVKNSINGFVYYTQRDAAIEWAKQNKCHLIQDGRFFYIDNLNKYIVSKKRNTLLNYKCNIQRLKDRNLYVTRNDVNFRLDHNLTSMPKPAMQIIKEDNDLIEIDLKNSQFAIHAAWLKELGLAEKHEDVKLYFQLCSTGMLYDNLASIWNVERKVIKQSILGMAFSKAGNRTPFKKAFTKLFPNVIVHMDNCKKIRKKENNFSVELQQREARIFIDNLYPEIKAQGFFCLTKHDSLIVKNVDVTPITDIVKSYFKVIDFEGKLDFEGQNMNSDAYLIG